MPGIAHLSRCGMNASCTAVNKSVTCHTILHVCIRGHESCINAENLHI